MITPNQTPSVIERRWNGNKTHDLGTSISIWSFERAPHVPNRRPSNTTTKVSDCVSETFHINLWILMPRFPFNFSRIRLQLPSSGNPRSISLLLRRQIQDKYQHAVYLFRIKLIRLRSNYKVSYSIYLFISISCGCSDIILPMVAQF